MFRRFEWLITLIACLGLAMVALSGCASCQRVDQSPPCVSSCGMLLDSPENGSMSCSDLDKAEAHMLRAIDERFCKDDPRLCKESACKAIFGWQLQLGQEVITLVVQDLEGVEIRIPAVGLSNCSTREMWLGANQSWRHGSYPHEIFHVAQDCVTNWEGKPTPERGYGHEGWEDHGIYDFIEEIRRGN